MSTQPKISIIMPVLNRGSTIEKAIKSVISQSYKNFELIILDGGSTDTTLDVIRKYEPYITYWHSQHDGNPCIAVNTGIRRATGDLVAILMSDDFYEPDVLKKVAEALTNNPDADIITCGGRIIFLDKTTNTYKIKRIYSSQEELELNFHNVCHGVSAICCRFIRKSLYQNIGTFIEVDATGKMPHSNDKEFLLRAIVHGVKNVTIDYIGHNYLSHSDSLTFNNGREITVKLYIQHMWITEMYLARKDLTNEQRRILTNFQHHQSARLAFYYLYKQRYKDAFAIIKKDLPRHHVKWLFSFFTAAPDFFRRKMIQHIRDLYRKLTGSDVVYGKAK